MADLVEMIRLVTLSVQKLVDDEFSKVMGDPMPGSALDQVNLREGDQVIYEYLKHREFGLAVEHIDYMVEETGVELSESTRCTLSKIKELMR